MYAMDSHREIAKIRLPPKVAEDYEKSAVSRRGLLTSQRIPGVKAKVIRDNMNDFVGVINQGYPKTDQEPEYETKVLHRLAPCTLDSEVAIEGMFDDIRNTRTYRRKDTTEWLAFWSSYQAA